LLTKDIMHVSMSRSTQDPRNRCWFCSWRFGSQHCWWSGPSKGWMSL